MARRFDVEQRKVTEIAGIEAGYRYVDSPVIAREPGDGPDPDNVNYVPTTWPGARLPHVWLADGTPRERPGDGTPVQDRLGDGYTLLRLGDAPPDARALVEALRATGAPLDVLDVPDAAARELYERHLVLVRPDVHVVWRGNAVPDDVDALAALATGRAPRPVST
jgi:hypothetical protein